MKTAQSEHTKRTGPWNDPSSSESLSVLFAPAQPDSRSTGDRTHCATGNIVCPEFEKINTDRKRELAGRGEGAWDTLNLF